MSSRVFEIETPPHRLEWMHSAGRIRVGALGQFWRFYGPCVGHFRSKGLWQETDSAMKIGFQWRSSGTFLSEFVFPIESYGNVGRAELVSEFLHNELTVGN